MMRNEFLRISVLLMTLLMLVGCVVSCRNDPEPVLDTEADTTEVATETGTETERVTEAATTSNEPTTYTVTFQYNDGRDSEAVTVLAGALVKKPPIPTRTYYTFNDWFIDAECTTTYDFSAPVQADTTLYAGWIGDVNMRITFNANGGENPPEALVIAAGNIPSSPEVIPTREGYVFIGWFVDAACQEMFNFDTAVQRPVTLYAGWGVADDYAEVKFLLNGETYDTLVVKKGETVSKPVLDQLVLISEWTNQNAPYDFGSPVTSQLVLSATAYTSGLVFDQNVVKAYRGTSTHVVIPETFDGHTITAIADDAFRRTSVISVTIPETVTNIGSSAFAYCDELTSVNLTSQVTSLGAYAFQCCDSLKNVGTLTGVTILHDGVFAGCTGLESLTLSENLETVGAYAFADCITLKILSLPDTIYSIDSYAFSGCCSLISLNIPTSLSYVGDGVFTGCAALRTVSGGNSMFLVRDGNLLADYGSTLVLYLPGNKNETSFTVPSYTRKIAEGAFSSNQTLRELIISDSTELVCGSLAGMEVLENLTIATIGDGRENAFLAYLFGAETALQNGTGSDMVPHTLHTVTVTGKVDTVADSAFYGCAYLEQINGVFDATVYGNQAFAYTALTEVHFPTNVEKIGDDVLIGCQNLVSITVPTSNISYQTLDGCLYNAHATRLLVVPATKTQITLPSGLESIASYAFYGSAVTKLSIPASVQSLDQNCLAGMEALAELEIPFIGGSRTENRYLLYLFGGTFTEEESDEADEEDEDVKPKYTVNNSGAIPATLTTVRLTEPVSELPDFAFAYATAMTELTFEANNLTRMGMYCYYSTALSSVTIFDTVTEIGDMAFARMENLEEMTIPGSVTSMGIGILAFNASLTSVTFEEGITEIPDSACYPYNSVDASATTRYYSALSYVSVPASVTRIGEGAFVYAGRTYNSNDGRYETVENGFSFILAEGSKLQGIDDLAFLYSALGDIALPATVESVGQMAFAGCESMQNISFGNAKEGSALTEIRGFAFAYCTTLQSMIIYKDVKTAEDVPLIHLYETSGYKLNIFYGGATPDLYVRGAEFYCRADHWDDYVDVIHEMTNNE